MTMEFTFLFCIQYNTFNLIIDGKSNAISTSCTCMKIAHLFATTVTLTVFGMRATFVQTVPHSKDVESVQSFA